MGNNKEINLFRVTANLYDFDQRDITKFVSFYCTFIIRGKMLDKKIEYTCNSPLT